MSFAATIPDGCRSFVVFFIMCIIWIVFMGFYLARSLCTWLLLSSHFFYEKCDFIAKILIYVGLRIRFYLFSTYNLKIWYFLGNRALKRLSKNLLSIKRGFSKAYKYFLDIRKNKSNFLNLRKLQVLPWTLRDLRKPTSPPLNLKFFLKSTRPSLPLKKAPPLSSSPFPLRVQGMYQPPYSVLKPLRYMVGGPSEVYASSRAAFFYAGMNPPCGRARVKNDSNRWYRKR